jgi:hypothetical protein
MDANALRRGYTASRVTPKAQGVQAVTSIPGYRKAPRFRVLLRTRRRDRFWVRPRKRVILIVLVSSYIFDVDREYTCVFGYQCWLASSVRCSRAYPNAR